MTKPVHREQQRFLEKDIQAGLATEFIRAAIQVMEEHQVVPIDWVELLAKLLGAVETISAKGSAARGSSGVVSEETAALRGAIDQYAELQRRCSNK